MTRTRPQHSPSRPADAYHTLICKLRWIGLDEEALRLQFVLDTLPAGRGRPPQAPDGETEHAERH